MLLIPDEILPPEDDMKMLASKSREGRWAVQVARRPRDYERLDDLFDNLSIHPDVTEIHIAEVKVTSIKIPRESGIDIDVSDW